MPDHRDDDLEQLVAELAATLDELDGRIDGTPARRESFLQFTEQYAIPTAIAMLEANIRVLEAVAGAIRISQGRAASTESTRQSPLGTLDRALSEVNDAVRGQPPDDDARQLLTEARDLRDEIRGRVDGQTEGRSRVSTPEHSDDATSIPVSEEATGAGVDIETELDQLRDEIDTDQ